jgi:hypothetical protein
MWPLAYKMEGAGRPSLTDQRMASYRRGVTNMVFARCRASGGADANATANFVQLFYLDLETSRANYFVPFFLAGFELSGDVSPS